MSGGTRQSCASCGRWPPLVTAALREIEASQSQ